MSDSQRDPITRRQALAAAVGGVVATAAVGACRTPGASPDAAKAEGPVRPSTSTRMPAVFVPHGGGPWGLVDFGLPQDDVENLAGYLRQVSTVPTQKPRALLVISAHWEEDVPTVMTSERPPMLFDYYGFPKAAYDISWPAPGDVALSQRVRQLLGAADIASGADPKRGFDHGAFVPLKLAYPAADVPAIQLSLQRNLDPEEHLAIGRALAPLRDEGVFIVGSGMTYHDMRGFMGKGRAASEQFDAWLRTAATARPEERSRMLREWRSAPSARAAHPREEHLLPLMVVAGAAGDDVGQVAYNQTITGVKLSGFHFSG